LGAGPRRLCKDFSELAPGKRVFNPGAWDKSRTPKCINIDGITLSAKIGLSCVEGIGNGGGEIDPKRILMA